MGVSVAVLNLLAGVQAPWVDAAVATSHCGRDLDQELGPDPSSSVLVWLA